MGFIMWAAYRQAANKSVPAPVDAATPNAPWWYDHVAAQAPIWAQAGVTAVLLPPPLKTNAGQFIGADGYGVYDDYDIGSKNQFFSVETRFGDAEKLLRCIAVCHAHGMDAYIDHVPHQRSGGQGGAYKYLGADGKTRNGRFPKVPGYFRGDPADGRASQDPVPVPGDDFSFGDELCPINAIPAGSVMDGLLAAGDWLFRRLGIDGCRFDDTKGMATHFVRRFCSHGAMAGKFIMGEYADGNPVNLNAWVWDGVVNRDNNWVLPGGGTEGRCSAIDFSVHYPVQAMCNTNSNWDMRGLRNALADTSSLNSVPFVESPDTDTNGFATVIWNKAMGYAWIGARTGYPMMYYKDFSDDKGCYGSGGMQPHLRNSIWIQNKLAKGAQVERHADFQTMVIERLSNPGPGLLAGLNNDQWNAHTLTVQTGFGTNQHLKDYSGNAPDIWTDGNGMATITLPRNINGLGTVAYSRVGVSDVIDIVPRTTTQTIFGAADLDIGPLVPGLNTLTYAGRPVRISCAKGSSIIAHLSPLKDATADVSFLRPDGTPLERWTDLPESGFYTVQVKYLGRPSGDDFELSLTYLGA